MLRQGLRGRRAPCGMVIAATAIAGAVVFSARIAAFVSHPRQALRPQMARHAMPKPAAPEEVLAVETAVEDDVGSVDDEILDLTPAEYQAALKAEMDRERSKNYVTRADGEVDTTRMVVPWRNINEKELEATARQRLAKDGILDPQKAREEGPRDSDVIGKCIGSDVYLEWVLNEPSNKVGYIVEKRHAQHGTFSTIATYEEQRWQNLLVRQESGSQTFFQYDQEVKPGDYVYRCLVRDRNGEVNVVSEVSVNVPESAAVNIGVAGIVFVVLFFGSLAFLFFNDSQDGY